ncbi:5'-3' exoribonuclease 1 isoform X1 [Hypanus sabinus]|uniref:5'-3' exoribonuclease 1 isoform X1 n=1 Tax=Hypanus sabinus TaxID=79690 RepID=UPI0028C38DF2|nr:5'-3' exoribonuclease 1 isoform X1 [Hypanus sabinus]XP_059849768.1 5'-3' exoribonuclease 1 isoform X1 [Hypanus sabinus]
MGVPKFYRWISERYPCLSLVVKEHQIPEFDNLYLDMNGIIHQCSHPNDEDVHFRISEEKIFADIFHYIEVLFRIIKPRKVFFMAVDGVAPRAKMNQQRGRRFRSAKEAEEKIKKALEKGESLPTEARFDSNCITPGTAFMARLHEQLKYFVNMKISSDKSWQGVIVYLSGHETPGEGEHKIMEFIRAEKRKPDHDPNTRHCLYGLDADLIMLGLTSHEPNFSLLREEVRFGGRKSQKRITAVEETTFHLLHLSLMREYIDYEFSSARGKISFEYDLEQIIDDWILMGFLVGNDFIPHLPHLHINHDALPLLYKTYIEVLPTLGGYINEGGTLNLERFEKYLLKLSEFDREHFSEVFVDLKWFESKVGKKYLNEAAGVAAEEAKQRKKENKTRDDLCLAVLDEAEACSDDSTELNHKDALDNDKDEDHEDEDDLFETEFRQYKRVYYMTKMGVEVVSDEFLAQQAECYVQAIQWILHYYYHGVQSWSWYYPYHYAPYLSDICSISKVKITFEMGKPFKPFEQLLAVLPAASKELLPSCYQFLMTNEESPIIEYYPPDFKTDLNGKQQEWEAVVLIPFIDEKLLLAAMESCNEHLSNEEIQRNRHSGCVKYWYDKEIEFKYLSPWAEKFPDVKQCHVRQEEIPIDAWIVPLHFTLNTITNNSLLYFCGFPTLKHIKHKFYLKKSGVQVFQQSSRGENMLLELLPNKEEENVDDVANQELGRSIFLNWPHLEEARVVAVSDQETKYYLDEPPGVQKLYTGKTPPPIKVVYLGDAEQNTWTREVNNITEFYHKRKGILINETSVLVYAQLLAGRRYVFGRNGEVTLEKEWSKQILPFAHQTTVRDLKSFDSSLSRFRTLDELFPPGINIFMLGTPYYGCIGEVQDSSDVITDGRIRVVFSVPCEPHLDGIIQNQHKYSTKYNPGYILASRLGITGYLVSRLTGSLFIGRGSKENPLGEQKMNVGLNLKFNKKNEEVPGYTKKVGNEWLYSSAVEQILSEYLERFPELICHIAKNSHEDLYYEDDIWSGEDVSGPEKVQEIGGWLKTHPVSSLSRASCDLNLLDAAIIEKIEEEVESCKQRRSNKKVRVTVKPHLLYRPLEQQHGIVPDKDAEYLLFDRVVNVREDFSVPVGLRGTIIGMKGAERESDEFYEVLFDEEFPSGLSLRCSSGRGYRLPKGALINLSHGNRLEFGSQKAAMLLKPQPAAVSQHAMSPSSQSAHKVPTGGLNHSPRSLFVPTQQLNGRQPSLRAENRSNQINHQKVDGLSGFQRNDDLEHKGASTKADQLKLDEFSNVWQSLQSNFGISPVPAQSNSHNAELASKPSPSWQEKPVSQNPSTTETSVQPFKTDGQQKQKWVPGDQVARNRRAKEDNSENFKARTRGPESTGQSQSKLPSKQACTGTSKQSMKILKRNEESCEQKPVVENCQSCPSSTEKNNSSTRVSSDFEELLVSLKTPSGQAEKDAQDSQSKENKGNNGEPLSPQSFAMKGTQMLKEILKIDGAHLTPDKETSATSNVKQETSPAASVHHEKAGYTSHQRPFKKLAAKINKPQGILGGEVSGHYRGQQSPLSIPVSELYVTCARLGLPHPDFSFIKTAQGLKVCQVKLANGLLVHGPQCHSDSEAQEKAAVFALQRLNATGQNTPLAPSVFPGYQPMTGNVPLRAVPPPFCQASGGIVPVPPHGYGPVPWTNLIPPQIYNNYQIPYSGNICPGGVLIGTHNQFVPLQVTKRRTALNKTFDEKEVSHSVQQKLSQPATTMEYSNTSHGYPSASTSRNFIQPSQAPLKPQDKTVVQTAIQPQGQQQPAAGSSGRRKQRKLAVNFGAPRLPQ